MQPFKRRLRFAAFLAGLAGAACGQELLDPVDNLRSDYRNEVHPYTNALDEIGVALGPGSGRVAANLAATAIETHESTVGVPISVQPANIMLGEKLEPPEGWNGAAPTIHNSGGMLVWLDYAKTVLAIEAGTVSIDWPLSGGGVESSAGVVSASPTKRPVRLYWTHERPKTVNDTYRTLQNSGPTVTFGSNYRVTLFETGSVKVWNDDSDKGEVKVGDVRLNGNELQAFEGASGTFLITYSRLDEATGAEVLLAT